MASSPGNYRRLNGILRLTGHSAILETTDERIVRVVSEENLTTFDGASVIVEGTITGDRLQLEWIGRPSS